MRINFKIKTFSGNFKKKILAKNKCEPPQNAWSGLKKLNLQQSVCRRKKQFQKDLLNATGQRQCFKHLLEFHFHKTFLVLVEFHILFYDFLKLMILLFTLEHI